MSNFPILDLVAGIIFIFFLLSIICSSVVEIVLTTRKIRSKVLGEWITGMFNIELPGTVKKDASGKDIPGTGKKLGDELIDHCALTALSGEGQPPSYIDAKNFVSALLEKITFYGPIAKDTIMNVPNKIDEYMIAIYINRNNLAISLIMIGCGIIKSEELLVVINFNDKSFEKAET